MAIETLDDYNAQASCCCPQTLCPIPAEVCESLYATFHGYGFMDPADTVFKIYKKRGWTGAQSQSETVLFDDPNPEIDGQIAIERETTLDTFYGQQYDFLYEGSIGSGGEGCPYYLPTLSDTCSLTGTSSYKSYSVNVWSDPDPPYDPNYVHGLDWQRVNTVEDAEGDETLAHIAWAAIFGDFAAWAILHAAWVVDHAAWQSDFDAWQIAWNDWDAGGQIGPEPTFTDPEPVEPEAEPLEFYPACTYKVTSTFTYYAHFWGYNSGTGTSAAPATDNAAFQDWLDAGAVGSPPNPGTGTLIYFDNLAGTVSIMNESSGGDPGTPYSETSGVLEPTTYAAWMAEVQAVIDAGPELPSEACGGTECSSLFYQSPEPAAEDAPFSDSEIILHSRRARSRWLIPATWNDQVTGLPVAFPGTYFVITYDILEEPDGWNDTIDDPGYIPPIPNDPPEPIPQIPRPGRPTRSFYAEDVTKAWTGPGVALDETSWIVDYAAEDGWITLDPPTVPGTRRIVNRRLVCRENWGLGVLPQVWGEAVTLPDP